MSEEHEIWKDVPGYEGLYLASNKGRVKSLPRKAFGSPRSISGGLLRPRTNEQGRLTVNLSKEGRCKTSAVARIIARTFLGPRNGLQVNHINGIKTDNRLINLEYCTGSENILHAYKMGLKSFEGEKHPRAKVTENQVREIRNSKLSSTKIASMYGIAYQTVRKIISRRSWDHVN